MIFISLLINFVNVTIIHLKCDLHKKGVAYSIITGVISLLEKKQ